MKLLPVLFSLVLLLLFSGVADANSQTIINMTGVNSIESNTNFDDAIAHPIMPTQDEVYIELPSTQTLYLNLYFTQVFQSCTVYIFETSFFNASNITWNNKPSSIGSALNSFSVSTTGWYNISLSNPPKYLVLKRNLPAIDYIYIASDNSGTPPYIVVPDPIIISHGNNKTNNASLNITVLPIEFINFNSTANQIITTWNWYKDDISQSWNYNNFTTNFTAGNHTIKINATNANGTSNTITWNVNSQAPPSPFDPSGYVKDQAGTPIVNAQVSTFGGACSVLSDSNGFYDCSLYLANGTYLFTGAKVGYTSNSTSYQIALGSGNPANLTLTATTSPPSILSWQNNKTNNNSLNISEYPTDVIKFNVTANQSITSWNWYKDSILQVNNFDNYTTAFALGSHTISVNGTNALGTSNSITWNITQPPPDITSWGNNKTNNDTLSLSVISANIIRFNATANQSITTWQWYKDNVLQSNNYDNYTTKFLDGSHTLSVNGTNVNGVTNTITWTIASSVSYDPSGYINKTTGERVAYATVRLSNATFNTSVIANATGYWNANIYADGLYNYTVSKGGYVIASGNQTFNVGGTNNNFTLSCLGNLTACNIPDTNSRGYNVVVYDFQGNGFNLINFSWIHAISGFIFPDNTVQTTAYSPTGVNYSNLTNLPSTYPNSSIPALQSNDSYFNGSVFPNSTNFRNDSLQTQINTANTTANTANSTANNAQAALNGYNSSGYPNASLQSQINGKEPTITGSTNNVFWNGLKAWTALSSANISDIGNYLLISTYGTNFPNSTAVTANNTANTANSTANSKLTNVSAGDSVAITWSGGIAQINFSMTNISQITGSNGITTTTLSDGVGGLTNITVSGGLSATWI